MKQQISFPCRKKPCKISGIPLFSTGDWQNDNPKKHPGTERPYCFDLSLCSFPSVGCYCSSMARLVHFTSLETVLWRSKFPFMMASKIPATTSWLSSVYVVKVRYCIDAVIRDISILFSKDGLRVTQNINSAILNFRYWCVYSSTSGADQGPVQGSSY